MLAMGSLAPASCFMRRTLSSRLLRLASIPDRLRWAVDGEWTGGTRHGMPWGTVYSKLTSLDERGD